jgi:hypothetical protein
VTLRYGGWEIELLAGTWPESLAPAFPSTPVHVADFDLDWWWSAEERRLTVGPRILRTLQDSGVLETFSEGVDVLPGVRARSAPGHCAGHCVLEVAGADGVLLHIADAIHHRSHVEHPDWDGLYDRRADVALATRKRAPDRGRGPRCHADRLAHRCARAHRAPQWRPGLGGSQLTVSGCCIGPGCSVQ